MDTHHRTALEMERARRAERDALYFHEAKRRSRLVLLSIALAMAVVLLVTSYSARAQSELDKAEEMLRETFPGPTAAQMAAHADGLARDPYLCDVEPRTAEKYAQHSTALAAALRQCGGAHAARSNGSWDVLPDPSYTTAGGYYDAGVRGLSLDGVRQGFPAEGAGEWGALDYDYTGIAPEFMPDASALAALDQQDAEATPALTVADEEDAFIGAAIWRAMGGYPDHNIMRWWGSVPTLDPATGAIQMLTPEAFFDRLCDCRDNSTAERRSIMGVEIGDFASERARAHVNAVRGCQ